MTIKQQVIDAKAELELLDQAGVRAWANKQGFTNGTSFSLFKAALADIGITKDLSYVNLSTVKKRGWTDKIIKELLGEPDCYVPNPYYKSAPEMKLYAIERVVAAEHTDVFQKHIQKKPEVLKKIIASDENRAERKRQAAIREVELKREWAERNERIRIEQLRQEALKEEIKVHIPVRTGMPYRMEAFLGPTNSGKTYQALQYLIKRGRGVYACPLRMLAYEAYETLVTQVGADNVGCVTGEEKINEHAPIICCTAEMAPLHSELLVLDEVQWANDKERGWAWTRLLLGANVDELYLTGETGAEPFIKAIFGNAITITYLERLCPLELAGRISIQNVPTRSAVIGFSRKAVLHLAGLLSKNHRKVAVLYGALPPEVRRKQIASFISGEAEIVVATDVIGHGINLPVDNVVFSSTDKFDGEIRRDLRAWEVAQIAGRAGRFGLSDKGKVYALSGVPGFEPDINVIKSGVTPRIMLGTHLAYRTIKNGFIAPDLEDLNITQSIDLPGALNVWEELAKQGFANMPHVSITPVLPLAARLKILKRSPFEDSHILAHLDIEDAWRLAKSPCDSDNPEDTTVLISLGRQLLQDKNSPLQPIIDFASNLKSIKSQERLEGLARQLDILRWATLVFEKRIDVTHTDVVKALNLVADTLNDRLQREISNGVAHCQTCGQLCPPWFTECNSCHTKAYYNRHNYYGYDDEYDDDKYDDDEYLYVSPPKKSKVNNNSSDKLKINANDGSDQISIATILQSTGSKYLKKPKYLPLAGWKENIIPELSKISVAQRKDLVQTLITKHYQDVHMRITPWSKAEVEQALLI